MRVENLKKIIFQVNPKEIAITFFTTRFSIKVKALNAGMLAFVCVKISWRYFEFKIYKKKFLSFLKNSFLIDFFVVIVVAKQEKG